MQQFRLDLKTFLGLAMSNQCCHAVTKLKLGWCVGGISSKKSQTLMRFKIGIVLIKMADCYIKVNI